MSQQTEDLIVVLKSINDLRRDFLARLRELEAAIEGAINAAPKEPEHTQEAG